jgi:hypothetical protein
LVQTARQRHLSAASEGVSRLGKHFRLRLNRGGPLVTWAAMTFGMI